MKIGIDIDDVIVDFCLPFAKFHNNKYGTNWSKENLNTYRLEDLTGDTWDEMQEKMDRFVEEVDFFSKKVDPNIVNSIKKLAQKHELYIITGRPEHYRVKLFAFLRLPRWSYLPHQERIRRRRR